MPNGLDIEVYTTNDCYGEKSRTAVIGRQRLFAKEYAYVCSTLKNSHSNLSDSRAFDAVHSLQNVVEFFLSQPKVIFCLHVDPQLRAIAQQRT